MARRTRSSVASAGPLPGPEQPEHAHELPEDASTVDFSGQLLTPENSRSETSSNHEQPLGEGEENPAVRRRSTRAKRASLRAIESMEDMKEEPQQYPRATEPASDVQSRSVSGETLVNSILEGHSSRTTLLRHSLAVMETTSWSQTTLERESGEDAAEVDAGPDASNSQTPDRKQGEDTSSVRTLRKRDQTGKVNGNSSNSEKQTPTRRSSRLSLLGKATNLVDRASSLLGKRSRDMMEKGKEIGRRASLRPRTAKEEPAESTSRDAPAAKKRRVSESDLPSKAASDELSASKEPPTPETPPRYKPKRWLLHGLYTGQEPTTEPPRVSNSRANNARRKSNGDAQKQQRKLLPMPMFAGDRLLKNGRDFKLPFDIFSPLPPGQPKPDEWRKTNKNVFVGEAASIWKANKHVELSTCMCTPETGCDENCQNRYMFYECDDSNCRLGLGCGNRNFEELKHRTKAGGKYNIGVEVIKTMDRGYGVRSNRSFEPNQIIVEYTGEIITQSECENRMRTIYKNNECYYLMYFDQNMIIDATRGSIARFVNHSCEPNCRMEKWTVAGKPRMALFAGDRGIMTGEELTYDYNFDPFSQKNVQECRCGASTCRGVLGPRPKDQRPKEPKVDDKKKSKTKARKGGKSTLAGTKRKLESVLDESTSRLNKKRKLLTPKSIKAGVKKAVSKARTSVSGKGRATTQAKSTTTKKTVKKVAAKSARSKLKPKMKTTKTGAKTVAKPKAKATVYRLNSKATSRAPSVRKASNSSNKSASTSKAKASPNKRSTPTKGAKASPKRATKATKETKKSPTKTVSRRGSVKDAAKSVVRTVKRASKASTKSAKIV
ncbi:hypothetical protein DTO212C5_181 [Paecilomyces variotii]|nr:hypothetical protein DTO212C5_181 [Paecilomyces variotii]